MAAEDTEVGGRVALEDAFSSVAERVGRAARGLYGGMQATVGRLRPVLSGASGAFHRLEAVARPALARLGAGLTAVEARARGALGVLGGMARGVGGFLSTLTGSLGGFGQYLSLGGLAQGFHDLLGAASRAASEMENLRIAFTTMLGSADAANAHLRELQSFAVGKPFEFKDLVVASRNLQTFGFGVGEVTGLLTDFGNAAFTAGTGLRGVQSMTRVFGVTLATNKITLGQLGQLVRAGIPAFQILREQLHLTDDQLRNIARSGIPARTIIDALRRGMQQRFAGGMDRAATTITAALSDMQDVAGIFLSRVGDELRPVILGFLNEVRGGLGRLDFDRWAQRVASTLATVMFALRALAGPLLGAFSDVTGGLRSNLDRILGNVRDVAEGLAALLGSEDGRGVGRIPRALHDRLVRNGLWPMVVKVAQWGDRIRQVIRGFVEGVVERFDRFRNIAQQVAGALGLVNGSVGLTRSGARSLGGVLVTVLATLVAVKVVMLAVSGVMAVVRVATLVATAAQWLWNASILANPITWIVIAVVAAVALLGYGIYKLVKHWDQVKAAVGRVWTVVKTFALGVWASITGALSRAWNAVKGFFVRIGSALAAAFTVVAGFVIRIGRILLAPYIFAFRVLRVVVQTLALFLWAALAYVWTRVEKPLLRFVDAVRRVAHRLWAPLVAAGRWVVGALAGVWAQVKIAAEATWARLVGAWVSVVTRITKVAATISKVLASVWGRVRAAAASTWSWIVGRVMVAVSSIAMLFAGLRDALSGVWHAVASVARFVFGGLVNVVLGPLRLIIRGVLRMFDSLPARLQPAGLRDMANSLRGFAQGGGVPTGGAAEQGGGGAVETPAAVPAISRMVVQNRVSAARAGGAAAPPPQVSVQPVFNPTVVVRMNDREILRATTRAAQDEQTRRGGPGSED